jgi:hypothetical protein
MNSIQAFFAQDVLSQRVLRALYELGRVDRAADAAFVARLLGVRSQEVSLALTQLDALGLVRVETVRLSLLGLAWATRLPALEVGSVTPPVSARAQRIFPARERPRAVA